jgi:predicted nucleic acid-binding protein
MLPDSEVIISDTSCLILLSKIDELDLLNKVAQNIYNTDIIKKEFGREIPSWIVVRTPNDNHYQEILEMDLDKGEASAIALSLELENSILLLDDLKGRKIAERLNLRFSGTFGLILRAKQLGKIPNVTEIIEKIKATNFRFNEKLLSSIIEMAGE